jgi:hypothetical protein
MGNYSYIMVRVRKPGPRKGCMKYKKRSNMPPRYNLDGSSNPEYHREYWVRIGRTKPPQDEAKKVA